MHCKYCPEMPASYYCEHCDVPFCLDCVPEDRARMAPKCTLCRRQLTSIHGSHAIAPYYQELGRFLSMPFQTDWLVLLVLMSVGFLLLPYHGDFNFFSLLGVYWGLLLMLWFELLNDYGEGQLLHPKLSNVWKKAEPMVMLYLIIQVVIVVGVLYSIGKFFSAAIAIWLWVGGLLVAPASLMLFAMEKKMFSGLQIGKVFFIIRNLGFTYLVILLSMVLLWVVTLFVQASIKDSSFALAVPLQFISLYLWTVWFVLVGYITYQYHDDLGLSVSHRQKHHRHQQERKHVQQKSAALKEAEILVSEGRIDDAYNILHEAMDEKPLPKDTMKFYVDLLIKQQTHKRLKLVSERLMQMYISTGDHASAIELLSKVRHDYAAHLHEAESIEKGDNLRPLYPENPYDRLAVAKGLMRRQQSALALRLYEELSKAENELPEEHLHIFAEVYHHAGILYTEHVGDDARAISCFMRVLDDFSGYSETHEVVGYLKILSEADYQKYLQKLKSKGSDSDDDVLIIDP